MLIDLGAAVIGGLFRLTLGLIGLAAVLTTIAAVGGFVLLIFAAVFL